MRLIWICKCPSLGLLSSTSTRLVNWLLTSTLIGLVDVRSLKAWLRCTHVDFDILACSFWNTTLLLRTLFSGRKTGYPFLLNILFTHLILFCVLNVSNPVRLKFLPCATHTSVKHKCFKQILYCRFQYFTQTLSETLHSLCLHTNVTQGLLHRSRLNSNSNTRRLTTTFPTKTDEE